MRYLSSSAVVSLFLTGLVFMLSTNALAGDGIHEINQDCAMSTGCFPGDSAGFPVTITNAGSYRLTGNLLVGSLGIIAIRIDVSHVTVNLGGFEVRGPTSCTTSGEITCAPIGAGDGVASTAVTPIPEDVTVRNGRVHGFRFGVTLGGAASKIDDVQATGNSITGLGVGSLTFGRSGAVTNCIAHRNLGSGIFLGDDGLASGNVANENALHGIFARSRGVIIGNTMNNNGQFGLFDLSGSGYAQNVISGNGTGAVSGAAEMGTNICNGNTTCP